MGSLRVDGGQNGAGVHRVRELSLPEAVPSIARADSADSADGGTALAGGGIPSGGRTLRRAKLPGLLASDGGDGTLSSAAAPGGGGAALAPLMMSGASVGAFAALTGAHSVPAATLGHGDDMTRPDSLLRHLLFKRSNGVTPQSSAPGAKMMNADFLSPMSVLSPVSQDDDEDDDGGTPRDSEALDDSGELSLSVSHSFWDVPSTTNAEDVEGVVDMLSPPVLPGTVTHDGDAGRARAGDGGGGRAPRPDDAAAGGSVTQPPSTSSTLEDEKKAQLKPRSVLRVRLLQPQVLLQHTDADASLLLAPQSVRMLMLRGPVSQASAVFLRDSRKAPPQVTGGGIGGYEGEDPVRMDHEFHLRLRSLAGFMTSESIDPSSGTGRCGFLPHGHTAEVARTIKASADTMFSTRPSGGGGGGGGAGGGFGSTHVPLRRNESANAGTRPVHVDDATDAQDTTLRCVLMNADLQV